MLARFAPTTTAPRLPAVAAAAVPSCGRVRLYSATTPVRAAANSRNLYPRRILLVRHGQSLGNRDEHTYGTIPDWRVPLTTKGKNQAVDAGRKIHAIIGNESVHAYVSPYLRARQTLDGMLSAMPEDQVVSVQEEPRISEQQFGNFQDVDEVRFHKSERRRFGRFYYRFPNGEAGIDVYGRITGFLASMFREHTQPRADNVLIVTHGLALRLFLMRWYRWNVETFETTDNPRNCGIVVMERMAFGKFQITQDAGTLSAETRQLIREQEAAGGYAAAVSAACPEW